jgi:Holliday junction resolvasome RuvABC endonuclease subunit
LLVIGLDFSVNYPAFCIAKDWQSFEWLAAINTNIPKNYQKQLEDLQSEFSSIQIIQLEARPKKTDVYSTNERNKLVSYSLMIDALIRTLQPKVLGRSIVVSIEGIAYGAQGNALVDIALATGMVRKAILDKLLNGDANRLYIFSPSELKNAIGAKGNANKFEIFQQFKADPKIEAVKQSDLYKLINKYEDLVLKGQEIRSPFSDMVDSYLAALKIHEILKEPN